MMIKDKSGVRAAIGEISVEEYRVWKDRYAPLPSQESFR